MIELASRLNPKDRHILRGLAVLAGIGVIFYFFIAVRQKAAYARAVDHKVGMQTRYQNLQEDLRNSKLESARWDTALKDLEELRNGYFYSADDLIREIRVDMRGLFRKNGLSIPEIVYNYTEYDQQSVKKISASFDISGPYFSIKKFIHDVEIFPKFLVIEKVDIRDIDTQTGTLTISLVLAGYYEE